MQSTAKGNASRKTLMVIIYNAINSHINMLETIVTTIHYTQVYLVTRSSADTDKPARRVYRGQSWSPNIITFHILGIVFSCAIVTLSLSQVKSSQVAFN